jgi:hypothetical protein
MSNVPTYPSLLTQRSGKGDCRANVRKTPGYDIITGKVLKELPKKAVTLLTILYNIMLRLS